MAQSSVMHDLLAGAVQALLGDLESAVPSVNRKAVGWDKTQLARLHGNRGDRYLSIDLPQFGREFENALTVGSLGPSSVPGFARLRTRRGHDARPRLFWAFLSRVFRFDGTLRENACTTSIWAVRQLCYFAKNVKVDCDEQYKFAAIRDLYCVEEAMVPPDLDWDDPFCPYDRGRTLSVESYAREGRDGVEANHGWQVGDAQHFQRVFDLICGMLPAFDAPSIKGRHGPGAVSDGKRGESKFDFPFWSDKLESVFPFDWHGSHCFLQGETCPPSGVQASKLICVPKSQKGPRLIASEPICNQWVQQGISVWFLRAFGSTGRGAVAPFWGAIQLKKQSLSQEAARVASLGSGATIDLSSASDRLSCHLVERVFRSRPDILSAMMACRTSLLVNTIDKKSPRELRIKKFAMSGSALTFPVQSLVFYAICVASLLRVRGLRVNLREAQRAASEVRVYGDDLIVPGDVAEELARSLTVLGLKVNALKSFWKGYFRESCGADWYKGANVTPTYIRSDFDPRKSSTVSTVVESSNNFHRSGLWRVAQYLKERLPTRILTRVPVHRIKNDGDTSVDCTAVSGFGSFVGVDVSFLKKRYNSALHRWEFKVAQLVAEEPLPDSDGIARLRHYLSEPSNPDYLWVSKAIGRLTPVYRERYVPLYSGI